MKFLTKWRLAISVSVIFHLVILVFAAKALTFPVEKEPEYMEVSLDEYAQSAGSDDLPDAKRENESMRSGASSAGLPITQGNNYSGRPEVGDVAEIAQGVGNGPYSGQGDVPKSVVSGASGVATSQGVSRGPKVKTCPELQYPDEAYRNKIQGTVLLHLWISDQGLVYDVGVIKTSGYKQLDKAAIDYVRKWTFVPALKEGNPVSSQSTVPVRFYLIKG